MSELLRLLGLTQDGALVPYIVGGVGVWVAMSMRGLRADIKRGEDAHRAITEKIDSLGEKVNSIAVDVGKLLGAK